MDQYVRDPRLIKRLRVPATPVAPSTEEAQTNEVVKALFPEALPSKPVLNPSETHTRCALPPFDSTDGDAILRSSDLVDFHIRSAIVMEASKVLQDMFSVLLDQPPAKRRRVDSHDNTKELPTICVTEDSRTIDHLLRLSYCIDGHSITDPLELCAVLASAKKYELAHAQSRLLAQFSVMADAEPAKMYMLACRRGWEDCMRRAARASLTQHLSAEQFAVYEDVPAGLFVTAPEHARLLTYQRRCGLVASSLIGYVVPSAPGQTGHFTLRWLPRNEWVWFRCEHRPALMDKVQTQDGTLHDAARWWTTFLRKAQERLKERPGGATVMDVKLWGWYVVSGIEHCGTCKRQVVEDLYAFREILAREVEKVIDKVELDCGRIGSNRKHETPTPQLE